MTHEGYKAMLKEVIQPSITKSGRYRIYGGMEVKDTNVVSGRTADEAFEKLTRIEFPMYITKLVRNQLAFEQVIIGTNPASTSFVLKMPTKSKPIPYKKPAIIGGLTVDERVSPTCIHQGIPYPY